MHSRRMCSLAIIVTAVLLASAVMPITAYAEDPLPPPDASGAEGSPPPAEGSSEEIVPPLDGQVAQEALPVEPAEAGEVALEEPFVEEAAPVEATALPEVLEAAPEGTEVVILDETGAGLPLASSAAAEVLVSGDPMWCPGDSEPGAGCTTSHASFADLLADLADHSETGPGTIYVANNYSVFDDSGTRFGRDRIPLGILQPD